MYVSLQILSAGSLSRWTCFKWSDHILIQNIYRVFKKVILPNSSRYASSLFPGDIVDPDTWVNESHKEVNEKSESPKETQQTPNPVPARSSKSYFVSLVSSDEEDEVCNITFSLTSGDWHDFNMSFTRCNLRSPPRTIKTRPPQTIKTGYVIFDIG